MAKANFYLKNKDSIKSTLIYLQFTYKGNRLRVYLDEKVEPKNWDAKKKRSKRDISLNAFLNDVESKILKAYNEITRNENIVPSKERLKGRFEELIKPVELDNDFWGHYDLFIEERQQRGVVAGTIKTYKQLVNYLKKFAKQKRFNISYDSIDSTFDARFQSYLYNEDLTDNTVGKQIKTLKTFLKFATEKEWNTNLAYKKYKVIDEEADNIHLDLDEIQMIYDLDLSDKPNYDLARDLFVFACWTGLRFSDVSNMSNIQIEYWKGDKNKPILNVRMQKTRDTVQIPVMPTAKKILEKYDYALPKPYSNQDMNRKIKKIGKWAGIDKPIEKIRYRQGKRIEEIKPKHDMIMTHTARRSFATNLYYHQILPPKLLMKITGHKSESNFFKYIKYDNELAIDMCFENMSKLEQIPRGQAKVRGLKIQGV